MLHTSDTQSGVLKTLDLAEGLDIGVLDSPPCLTYKKSQRTVCSLRSISYRLAALSQPVKSRQLERYALSCILFILAQKAATPGLNDAVDLAILLLNNRIRR